MPKGMAGGMLLDIRLFHCPTYCLLDGRSRNMVALASSGTGILPSLFRWKQVLPFQLFISVGIFFIQCFWQYYLSSVFSQIPLVKIAHVPDLIFQFRY